MAHRDLMARMLELLASDSTPSKSPMRCAPTWHTSDTKAVEAVLAIFHNVKTIEVYKPYPSDTPRYMPRSPSTAAPTDDIIDAPSSIGRDGPRAQQQCTCHTAPMGLKRNRCMPLLGSAASCQSGSSVT
eukprot:5123041-Amphidinium_carterae.1